MLPELSSQEIALINQYNLMNPQSRKEVRDYLAFVLLKQYRAEILSSVMGNGLVYNGLQQAARMCEHEDMELTDIVKKIGQVKAIIYSEIERVYLKYAEVLNDLCVEHTFIDWARIGFESIMEAAQSGNRQRLRQEINEMMEGYKRLSKREDRVRIIAV